MLFRNLTLFRCSEADIKALRTNLEGGWPQGLETVLDQHRLRPVGPLEMSTHGFVSPFGDEEGKALSHTVGDYTLLTVGSEHKLLPGGVVNAALRKRCQAIEQETGKPVRGKARKALKEEIIHELLPKAFVSGGRLNLYLDVKKGWIVVDTGSRKSAENAVTAVREALGSFPALPIAPEESPRQLMTHWVADQTPPEGLAIGDACELKEPGGAQGATIRAKNQDLAAEELLEHLRNGKQVAQLAVVFEERLQFTLNEELGLKSLKFLDVAMAGLEEGSDAESELDAQFSLMTLEFDRLLDALGNWFVIQRPE